MCTVRLTNKDKDARCGFFVVPGDCWVLIRMVDIEVLNILQITCEVLGNPHDRKKFHLQTIEAPNDPSHKTYKASQITSDHMDKNNADANMPGYFRSSVNRAAKEYIRYWQKTCIEFSDFFSGINCFEGTFSLQVKDCNQPYHLSPRKVAHALQEPLKE